MSQLQLKRGKHSAAERMYVVEHTVLYVRKCLTGCQRPARKGHDGRSRGAAGQTRRPPLLRNPHRLRLR